MSLFFLVLNTKNHNLNCWVVSKSSLVCFAIRRHEISLESSWDLSWPYWLWGTLSHSQGDTTLCWEVFLFLCLTLPQALSRKEGGRKQISPSPKVGLGFLDLFNVLQLFWHGGRSLDVCCCIPPGTARFAKHCPRFTVALLHQYETRWPSFGPELVCRWETSLDDLMVLL